MGLVEGAMFIGILWVLGRVTLPQLGEARWRAQAHEAREVLHAAAAGARAHFLLHGSYNCGACGATPPADARFTYRFAPGPEPAEPCARLPAALPSGPGEAGFVMSASRPLGRGTCEVWRATAGRPLSRQRLPLGPT